MMQGMKGDNTYHLKRLRLRVAMRGDSEAGDGAPYEFIFGLGQGGLTPFEQEISSHGIGESFLINFDEMGTLMGHLAEGFPVALPSGGENSLVVRIDECLDATPREVIKALAEMASCHDHCCSC